MATNTEDATFGHPEPRQTEDLAFCRLNSEQTTQHIKNLSQFWSGSLSQRDYLEIEFQLASTAANRGTTWWALHDPGNPLGLISSCTVYIRDVVVGRNSKVEQAKAAIVAQVFTLPEHRRQGRAKQLLEKVQKELDKGAMGEVAFSVLYSDSHTEFYEKLGWRPYKTTHFHMQITGVEKYAKPNEVENVQIFGYQGLRLLSEHDTDLQKLGMLGLPDGKTYVQFLAHEKIAKLHIIRSKLLGLILYKGPGDMQNTLYGAMSSVPGSTAMAAAWWTHDFRSKRLVIGRFVLTRKSGMQPAIEEILHAVLGDAQSWGLREVVIHDPDDQVISTIDMMENFQKLMDAPKTGFVTYCNLTPDVVPCLRWTGEVPKGGVEWLGRQQFALP
jgi:GNAT superfamily N-acetyltransferase